VYFLVFDVIIYDNNDEKRALALIMSVKINYGEYLFNLENISFCINIS